MQIRINRRRCILSNLTCIFLYLEIIALVINNSAIQKNNRFSFLSKTAISQMQLCFEKSSRVARPTNVVT